MRKEEEYTSWLRIDELIKILVEYFVDEILGKIPVSLC